MLIDTRGDQCQLSRGVSVNQCFDGANRWALLVSCYRDRSTRASSVERNRWTGPRFAPVAHIGGLLVLERPALVRSTAPRD